jgi:hypothetical protein
MVSPLPTDEFVPNQPTRNQYAEPVVMWRMRRADGQMSHAVIAPRPDGATVMWFVNSRLLGYRQFDDWTGAIKWCDQLQAHNWAAGWRLAPQYDDTPAPRTS